MLVFPEVGLVIHDLVDGNSRYIDDYLKIYENLFPQYIRYLPLMRQRAEKKADRSVNERWHQWLLVMNDNPVGIIGFLYNQKRNVGLLMDFAIYPEARKVHAGENVLFSEFVLKHSMQQLLEDANENRFTAPVCLAAEVEHPALLKKYEEYGYVKFPVEYFEPPSTPELEKVGDKIRELGKMDFGRMYIGAFQIPGHPFDPKDSKIIKTILLAFLEDHYQLPFDHWLVQKVIHEIPV
ncbi:MAG: hypothetical protein IPG80_17715 [Anaerolineales bacterium]|jgi:hypothetical protein|uniref:hypothetical protein n=1 Tax=Candidatus Villigracilis vicinus TaxID=3140679 RepID=UPI0031373BC8|nr:hypothetical protein [Anaerolineales bacterium]MBK7448573.1 hypothetical protein [Anaerolineales bacterium]MBK9782576.1 hypothetical protein [Anaerolineales bacterium]